MSISVYGNIPLNDLFKNYNVTGEEGNYWITAEDGSTLSVDQYENGDVYGVTAYGFQEKKGRYQIMQELYDKYELFNEDEEEEFNHMMLDASEKGEDHIVFKNKLYKIPQIDVSFERPNLDTSQYDDSLEEDLLLL